MLELIEPAGPALSMFRNGTRPIWLPASTYGYEKSLAASIPLVEVMVRVISSGCRIRSRTTSSHDLPVIFSTSRPAVMNIRLLYCHRPRNDVDGSTCRRCEKTSCRDVLRPYQRTSCRGSPETWVTRSFTRKFLVAYSS